MTGLTAGPGELARGELRRLDMTEEHIGWIGDMLEGRCAPDLAVSLVDHVLDEERRHEQDLAALRPLVGEAADREAWRLHLMQEHLELVGRIVRGEVTGVPYLLGWWTGREEEEGTAENAESAEIGSFSAFLGVLGGEKNLPSSRLPTRKIQNR